MMKRIVVCLAAVLALAGMTYFVTGCTSKKVSNKKADGIELKYRSTEKVEPKHRKARVTFHVSIKPAQTAGSVRLWVPYPVSTGDQKVSNADITGNYSKSGIYTEGRFGNAILYAEWSNPSDTRDLTLAFDIDRSELVKKAFPESGSEMPADVDAYLAASNLVPVTGEPAKLAKKITKNETTSLGKAVAIYDYLVENTERDDSIKGCGTGDVCEILKTKKGKCVDLHSVFISMARSVGIPAREVFGINIPKEPQGDMTKAYHCRAEFYLPDYGWVPVDYSNVRKLMLKENLKLDDPKVIEARSYYFGAWDESYVAFGTGRDLRLNPDQSGPALNYFMYPYAEVDGRPLDWLAQDELKYSVTYAVQ